MAEDIVQSTVNTKTRQDLIKVFPCFASLTPDQSEELASSMHEVIISAHEKIVLENELVDGIYIIISGDAEVTREVKYRKKVVQVPIAVLRKGEGIGLNDTGFYSTTGTRTATVTALTDMLLLFIDLKELYGFLNRNELETSMYGASQQMMRMSFIKKSLPFATISHERLQWLADHVEEIFVPAQTYIFNQGEIGDKCYLIRSGKIEIITTDEAGNEHLLAILKPPALFGEATLITRTPRNATARAMDNCDLLVLKHEYLSELIESESNVANMFMTLMVDRSRPIRNPLVTIHHRMTLDQQQITILKNPDTGSYFKLSEEGFCIWQLFDGKNTMQEITLSLADQHNVFAPDVVAALVSKLTKAGFISNIQIIDNKKMEKRPLWVKAMVNIRRVLEYRVAFGDADIWIARMYQRYIRYLFTRVGQLILAVITICGIAAFIHETPAILAFFSAKHVGLLLLIALIPLSLIEVIMHELGHAFAVKAFGREVHFIGVGWYWFGPIAFTDTSDMWLSARKPRMLVNIVGVYVDVLAGSLSALLILVFSNPYLQGLCWLFTVYTFIGAFRMLSPLQEMDGYYVLMDWVEKPRLRQAAVIWLVKVFPKSLRHPRLLLKYKAEITYWVSCIIYLAIISILTLTVLSFVFSLIGIKSNPYVSLMIPFLVVSFSCLSIIADIRSQVEE